MADDSERRALTGHRCRNLNAVAGPRVWSLLVSLVDALPGALRRTPSAMASLCCSGRKVSSYKTSSSSRCLGSNAEWVQILAHGKEAIRQVLLNGLRYASRNGKPEAKRDDRK
jgi:hypothetical protein